MGTDATTDLELMVKELAEEFAADLKEVLDEYPRPLFSEKVDEESQRAEWAVIRQDPALVAQFFIDNSATVKTAIAYARKMENL